MKAIIAGILFSVQAFALSSDLHPCMRDGESSRKLSAFFLKKGISLQAFKCEHHECSYKGKTKRGEASVTIRLTAGIDSANAEAPLKCRDIGLSWQEFKNGKELPGAIYDPKFYESPGSGLIPYNPELCDDPTVVKALADHFRPLIEHDNVKFSAPGEAKEHSAFVCQGDRMKNRTCSLVFTLPKEGTISSVVIRYLSGNLKSKECSRVDRMKDVSAKAWYGYPGDKASVQESIFQKLNQKLDTPISNADSESASQGAPAESQVAH